MRLKAFLNGIFPLLYNVWWFATTYFVLYLFSGYINDLIKALKQEKLLKLITLLIVICSVPPTFMFADMVKSDLMWFFLLYLIAAYIRLYQPKVAMLKHSMLLGVAVYIFSFLSCIVIDLLGEKWKVLAKHAMYFSQMQTITMLLCAVLIFCGFMNMKVRSSELINGIGASTFGVYLIHDHEYVRRFLWEKVFRNAEYIENNLLMVHAIISIMLVFIICTIIDWLYHWLMRRLMPQLY